MKAEERHELKENELAGWIYHLPEFFNKYGAYVLFALALCLLAYTGYDKYRTYQQGKIQTAWSQLAEATSDRAENPALQLRSIIQTYEIKPVQALAYVSLGDYYVDTLTLGPPPGSLDSKITPEIARQEAQKDYEKVLSDYPDQDIAVVRAHLGLGRLYEDQGQWDKARNEYMKITDPKGPFSRTPFADLAKYRLDHLNDWSKPVVFAPPSPVATAPAGSMPSAFLPGMVPSVGPMPAVDSVLGAPAPAVGGPTTNK